VNCLRNNPNYDEVYNKRKNDTSCTRKKEKRKIMLYDKHFNDLLQDKDKSLTYETITIKNRSLRPNQLF